jgi:hypothetical protein
VGVAALIGISFLTFGLPEEIAEGEALELAANEGVDAVVEEEASTAGWYNGGRPYVRDWGAEIRWFGSNPGWVEGYYGGYLSQPWDGSALIL